MDQKRAIWKKAFINSAYMSIYEGGEDFRESLKDAIYQSDGDASCLGFDFDKACGWDFDEEEHKKYEQERAQMFQEIFGEPLY